MSQSAAVSNVQNPQWCAKRTVQLPEGVPDYEYNKLCLEELSFALPKCKGASIGAQVAEEVSACLRILLAAAEKSRAHELLPRIRECCIPCAFVLLATEAARVEARLATLQDAVHLDDALAHCSEDTRMLALTDNV